MPDRKPNKASSVIELIDKVAAGEVVTVLSNRSAGTELDEALLEAISKGNRAEVERLVVDGADVNARLCTMVIWVGGNEFETPLMAAAEKGDREVVEFLLYKGADPSVCRELREDIGDTDYRFVGTGEYESAADIARKGGNEDLSRLLSRRASR